MVLSLVAYLAIILFLGLSVRKAYQLAKLPMHGRMDLYPVPKEKGYEHGGSYYEEILWWKKTREVSHLTEIIEMLKEILFIKTLFDNQRPFWWLSYALHLGIYFLMAWTVLLVAGAVSILNGIAVAANTPSLWGLLLYYLTFLTGTLGFILATLGSGLLIIRRMFDSTLRKYTTPQEYFNLALIFVTLITGILAWGIGPSFQTALEATANLISFTSFSAEPLMIVNVILVAILLTYIPLSKMSHYVGKYFTFHTVLWDNSPNLKGSAVEEKVKKATAYRPTTSWSAPHISGASNSKK